MIRDLGAAHQAGILHGELTTDPLLLNDQGVLKITFSFQADTLIAPQYGSERDFIPDYIPSEVRSGENNSPCGEVYSLCTAIYTCLTGLPPMEAWHKWSEMCGGFPPLGKLGLLPHWQDQIIMRGMNTRKDQRWQNMEELHAALYSPTWKRTAGKQFLSLWTFLKKTGSQTGLAAPLSGCSRDPAFDSNGNDPLAAGCGARA